MEYSNATYGFAAIAHRHQMGNCIVTSDILASLVTFLYINTHANMKYSFLQKMLERVYQNQKIRPVVYPFSKQPWVVNGQNGRKKRQREELEKPPFIFGEYTTENNYPSARWQTESQSCYRVINSDNGTPGGRILITSKDKHTPIEGVVPFDQPFNKFNVKKEMFLPAVCDLLKTPTAANPHKYMLPRRRIPAPYTQMGIFYPESPDPVKFHEGPKTQPDQISISSLCGQHFTRKKYIPQPRGSIQLG